MPQSLMGVNPAVAKPVVEHARSTYKNSHWSNWTLKQFVRTQQSVRYLFPFRHEYQKRYFQYVGPNVPHTNSADPWWTFVSVADHLDLFQKGASEKKENVSSSVDTIKPASPNHCLVCCTVVHCFMNFCRERRNQGYDCIRSARAGCFGQRLKSIYFIYPDSRRRIYNRTLR